MSDTGDTPVTFADLGLDSRLLRALEKREYEKPTPVQVNRRSLRAWFRVSVATTIIRLAFCASESLLKASCCHRQHACQQPWRAKT